jgi:hypothetical protein
MNTPLPHSFVPAAPPAPTPETRTLGIVDGNGDRTEFRLEESQNIDQISGGTRKFWAKTEAEAYGARTTEGILWEQADLEEKANAKLFGGG